MRANGGNRGRPLHFPHGHRGMWRGEPSAHYHGQRLGFVGADLRSGRQDAERGACCDGLGPCGQSPARSPPRPPRCKSASPLSPPPPLPLDSRLPALPPAPTFPGRPRPRGPAALPPPPWGRGPHLHDRGRRPPPPQQRGAGKRLSGALLGRRAQAGPRQPGHLVAGGTRVQGWLTPVCVRSGWGGGWCLAGRRAQASPHLPRTCTRAHPTPTPPAPNPTSPLAPPTGLGRRP